MGREDRAVDQLDRQPPQQPDREDDLPANEEIGPLLKRLRGPLSLRDVTRRAGVSSSYLSEIERGERQPGPNVVRKLAGLYRVDEADLLKRAGHGPQPDPHGDDALEVERAYRYVLDDPHFRVGTRPDGPLTLNSKRFIVEMYQKLTGRRLLE